MSGGCAIPFPVNPTSESVSFSGYFPDTWSFKCMVAGTPGEFPDGADYSIGYKGKGHRYVIGYMA